MKSIRTVILSAGLTAFASATNAGPALQRFHNGKIGQAPIGNLDRDKTAPVDYGAGPGLPKARALNNAIVPMAASADAYLKGAFGNPFTWPVIPIHTAVLPDGRIIGYGTDQTGLQGHC